MKKLTQGEMKRLLGGEGTQVEPKPTEKPSFCAILVFAEGYETTVPL